MTNRIATLPVLGAALLLLASTPALAQGYEGVLADDGGAGASAYDSSSDEPVEKLDIHARDYYKKKREIDNANRADFKAERTKAIEAAAKERAQQAKTAQEEIDARVKAAVTAPSSYGTRLSDIKVAPPQTPQGTTPPAAVTPPTAPTAPTTGGGSSGGGDRAPGQNRSVLERMMNALD